MAKSFHSPRYQQFRLLLCAAREKSNLTQTEVANRLRRPQSFVAKYEGGERRVDIVEFIDICSALEIEPIEILEKLTLSNEQTNKYYPTQK